MKIYRTGIFTLVAVLLLLSKMALCQEKLVFDFESGSLEQENWVFTEGKNSKPLGSRNVEFHNEKVPYVKHGKYYLTTLERAVDNIPTDDNLCTMESPVFILTGDSISLLVGGGNRDKTLVQLGVMDEKGDAQFVRTAKGKNNQSLDEITWSVPELKNKKLLIQVVDQELGSWGHIRCDNIRIPGRLDNAATLFRRAHTEKIRQEQIRLAQEAREKARHLALEKLPEPVLYVTRQQYRPDHHNTETIFQTGELNTNSFVGGSSMKIWDPQTDKTKTLLISTTGIIRDPTVSFDAKKVLFSLRKSKKDDYHIAEITLADIKSPVTIDEKDTRETLRAKGVRQLTSLAGISDIDPIYLPDGTILFSSTREPKFCMCNRHPMCNLYTMQSDGSNIQQIGKSTLFEGHSSLLHDGRIIYDRWEYVDRNFGDAQGVWVTNPDGTKHEIFWGNNTAVPGAVLDSRVLPGYDSRFICTFSSCHDRPWGAIALVDRQLGLDGKEPVLETWPPLAKELIDNAPDQKNFMKEVIRYDRFKQLQTKFEDPYPLSDTEFLASGQTGKGEEMGIWFLKTGGIMTLLHEDAPGCYDPTPIMETDPPMMVGNRVNLESKSGTFLISNVYEGMGMEKVKPGSIKYLRVVESPEKRFWTDTCWDIGNGTQAPAMAWDDFNNKRILGTVPIEEDGSVYFEVPSERFVYFQVLDADGALVQSMRSGIMVRPGEVNGCVGCHESRLDAPATSNLKATRAMAGPPQKLSDWYGPERLFSYTTEVQPVFDKYCITCHDYGKKGAQKVVLAGDLNLVFNTSYTELRMKGYVKVPGAGPHNKLPANSWGSKQSKLGEIVLNGHPDKTIDAKRKELGLWLDRQKDKEAIDRIITWIDINAPYYPTYSSAYPKSQFGRAALTMEELKKLEELTGMKCLKSGDPKNLAFAVSLTRPELSPCLNKWSTKEARMSGEYKEALSLISKGAERLTQQSRGENEDFQPVWSVDITRQQKYNLLKNREHKMRQAIRDGKWLYDWDL